MSVFATNPQAALIQDGGPAAELGYAPEFLTTVRSYSMPKDGVELGLTSYYRMHRLMTVMEQATPDAPAWPDEATFRLRVRLDLEEQFEKLVLGYFQGDVEQIIDGACDVEVVGTGSSIAFGINHEHCIAEVDRSNLSKLGEDGKPIKRADGKFLKGPNYTPPDFLPFLGDLPNTKPPYDTQAITREEFRAVVLKWAEKCPEFFVKDGFLMALAFDAEKSDR
jgi:predicted HAD superfamily Cof-like phosphohydrolase